MRWRLLRETFERDRGEPNRRRLEEGIRTGDVHGVLGYLDTRPVAWCSFGPRERFPMLGASEALASIDARPVWAISCFYVTPQARRRGATEMLLQAVIEQATNCGVATLEGYPLDPMQPKLPVAACWTGLLNSFLRAGFVEVARRAPARPIVRLELDREDL